MEKATFAAGCFWGVEAEFRKLEGVTATVVGYTGGSVEDPTYEQVCTGATGHAEAVEIEFDPDRVTYPELLDVFWAAHNPTTLNRQGWDIGTQYRSAIFYHDDRQKELALASQERAQAGHRKPIVTEIVFAGPFYAAEEYHQRYLEKRGVAACTPALRATM